MKELKKEVIKYTSNSNKQHLSENSIDLDLPDELIEKMSELIEKMSEIV